MTKINLTDLANLQNETTAVNAINANNAILEIASDNTLSRDGTSPNQMNSLLDMNSNIIVNLPAASSSTEPVRKQEFDAAVFGDFAGLSNINGTANQITVSTVGSVSTISTPAALTFTGKTVTNGTFNTPTINNPTVTNGTFSAPTINNPILTGVTNIGFTATGTGAVATTIDAKLKTMLYASDFGVVGDGTTVNDTFLQNAVNAAQTQHCKLMLPPGSIKLTTTISITDGVTIEGHGIEGDNGFIYGNQTTAPAFPTKSTGWQGSCIVCGITNGAFITATNKAVHFRNFQVHYPARPNAGVIAFNLASASSTNGVQTFMSMKGIHTTGADIAVQTRNTLNYCIDGCTFQDTWGTPLICNNSNIIQYTGATNCASIGDDSIINCNFFTTVGANHILVSATGGLRIINNKFNQSSGPAIFFAPIAYTDPGIPTNHEFSIEPVIISGNSIEGSPIGIQFQPNSSSHCLADEITITGNQIWATTQCINLFAGVFTALWISDVVISGNALLFGSVGGGAETGIVITGAKSTTITGNTIVSIVAGNSAYAFSTATYASTNRIRCSNNIDGVFPTLSNNVSPAVPASTVAVTNGFPHPVLVLIGGGTVTNYIVNGLSINNNQGASFTLPTGATIAITYSVAPTWQWYAISP